MFTSKQDVESNVTGAMATAKNEVFMCSNMKIVI